MDITCLLIRSTVKYKISLLWVSLLNNTEVKYNH